MLYKFMSNIVKDPVTMLDNRREFKSQTVFHNFRQRISIDGMSIFVAHIHQFIIGTGDFWIVGFPFFRQRLQNFTLFRYFSCVGNYDFNSFFFGKIRKFIQHFLCSTDKDGGMGFDFSRLFPVGKENVPVSLIFGKHIVSIRSSTYRHTCLFSNFDNFTV